MFKFWVEDKMGKIAEYEICAVSETEARETVERYACEDGFYNPIIELID